MIHSQLVYCRCNRIWSTSFGSVDSSMWEHKKRAVHFLNPVPNVHIKCDDYFEIPARKTHLVCWAPVMLYIMVNTCIKNNSLLVGHFFGEKPNVSLYRRVLPLKLQLTLAILLVINILVLGFNLLIENRSTVAQDSRQRDASRC